MIKLLGIQLSPYVRKVLIALVAKIRAEEKAAVEKMEGR